MSFITITIVVVALVLILGIIIFLLMRRSQTAIPNETDRRDEQKDLVVGTDEQGNAVTASEDLSTSKRDMSAFDKLLDDELDDRGLEHDVPEDAPKD